MNLRRNGNHFTKTGSGQTFSLAPLHCDPLAGAQLDRAASAPEHINQNRFTHARDRGIGCLARPRDLYLPRATLVYKPTKDLNRDWSPRFSTLRDKSGWVRAKTAGNLNLGVSRNRFCDF
jgi:hypothetical protein